MTTPNPDNEKDSIPFYPDHVKTEFYVTLGFLVLVVIIGILGLFFPLGLQDPADPMNTPAHVKPEWYFLALYQLLKYVPPTILGVEGTIWGVVVPLMAVLLVLIWPFLDRRDDSKRAIWIRMTVVILGVILFIALTIWGETS